MSTADEHKESSVSDDPRSKLLYDEGLRQIADAATDLAAIRTRASGLVSAIGVATSSLGATDLKDHPSIPGTAWAAMATFGLAMLIGAGVLALPVPNWVGGFDVSTVTDWIAKGLDTDAVRLALAEQLSASARDNRAKVFHRQVLLGVIGALFLAEILLWIIDLA